jgi:hypothetical protein
MTVLLRLFRFAAGAGVLSPIVDPLFSVLCISEYANGGKWMAEGEFDMGQGKI